MRLVCITILLLLGGLPGCRPGEQVSVSGAVEEPGDYAYRRDWQAMDYVIAAGGFLSEADTLSAQLIRVPADTTGEIDYDQIQKWPLDERPEIVPGDQILVPHLTYSVRLDTLREVRDLRVAWKGRTYHLSRGLIAPGWTARGVMTAVVLGHGKITEKKNGEVRALAGFRFLFLQMHPGGYEQVLGAVGTPVQDREAMEDVVEVHRFLFDRSAAFKAEGALQMAPPGYIRVLAGVWAKPKTRAQPGSGIRKKEYSDGRIWSTYPDGRQRMEYPDGKVEVDFPGEVKEIRHPDGRIERTDPSGNHRIQFVDGREVWAFQSGSRTTIYPDGRKVYEWPNGVRQRVMTDGTEHTVFPGGSREVSHPDGRKEVIDSTGARETHYPDGRIVAVMPDGLEITRYPDGTVSEVHLDGRKMRRSPSGEVLEITPTGQRRWIYGEGAEVIKQIDGKERVQYRDGTVLEVHPDGRHVKRKVDGTTVVYYGDGRWVFQGTEENRLEMYPDGRQIRVRAGGDRIESFPDGRRRLASPDPYRYRGKIHGTLASVEGVLEAVAPGEKLRFEGTVSDSVHRIDFAAFKVPDGDVRLEPIFPKDGRFKGRIGLGKAGHYQVQMMAWLDEVHVKTVMDRRVRVGNPEPLDTVFVDVPPYLGPDLAAERLVGLIDSVRLRLKRRKLRVNLELTRMAKDRLKEVLAAGFLSHLSPVGELVSQQLRERQVFLVSVGENLAWGHSLEEVHFQLMMSAGHRRTILAEGWTTVGVAVDRAHGMVWVVELFGRM